MNVILGLLIGWLLGAMAIGAGAKAETAFMIIAICAAGGLAGM